MKSPVCFHEKRSAFLRIVPSIVTIALLSLTSAMETSADAQTTPSPADWTEFHRDNMQRWNPYETVLGINNVGSLQVKWKAPLGAPSLFRQSSPAVINGVVYFGSCDGNVYAINASTGAKLWTYSTGGLVESSPAVVNGIVYVGSLDGNVYALKASTGAKLWSYITGGNVESSPAVVNGVVYVGGGDGNFYALNANTGAKLWSYPANISPEPSPAVANGVVYIGSDFDDHVYALNASTGALLWSFAAGSSLDGSPAVANGIVYIGSFDGNVYALNASTGAKIWSTSTGSEVTYSSAAVANRVVYIASHVNLSDVGDVYALNASTGAKLWTYSIGPASSSPTVVDGVLYVHAGDTSGDHAYAFTLGSADLFLRIIPSMTTVHQGDLLTYAFPVWNRGPDVAEGEVLSNLQVPAGTTFDYIRISGTPGLGTCTHPPYGGTGQIVCHEGDGMAPNTTWTVRVTVKVTAPPGTVITESAATLSDTPDPNMARSRRTRQGDRQ